MADIGLYNNKRCLPRKMLIRMFLFWTDHAIISYITHLKVLYLKGTTEADEGPHLEKNQIKIITFLFPWRKQQVIFLKYCCQRTLSNWKTNCCQHGFLTCQYTICYQLVHWISLIRRHIYDYSKLAETQLELTRYFKTECWDLIGMHCTIRTTWVG